MYIANRLDEEVTFTENACKQLTGIPKVFVKTALKGIIKEAKVRASQQLIKHLLRK